MNINPHQTHHRRGFAYLTVLGVSLTLTAVVSVGVNCGLQQIFTVRRNSARVHARAIAEAGISYAYVTLATDFDSRDSDDAFPVTPFAGGTYDVTVLSVGDEMAVITSHATYQGVTDTVILDVRKDMLERTVKASNAYGYAILVDGQISWTGCGVFYGGARVHANDQFKQAGSGELNADISSSTEIQLLGNSGEVDGDAIAPVIAGKVSKVTGVVVSDDVPHVPTPSIDLLPYYQEALDNDQVYEGSQTISAAFAPAGGIMWINGDLQVAGSEDITGCFIATGDIHHSGSGNQHKVEGYPAFISRDGNIKFSGSGHCDGLVHTRIGNVEVVGSGSVTGSIICGGDFKKAGVSSIFSYVVSVPVAPDEVESDGVLCVSAWQK